MADSASNLPASASNKPGDKAKQAGQGRQTMDGDREKHLSGSKNSPNPAAAGPEQGFYRVSAPDRDPQRNSICPVAPATSSEVVNTFSLHNFTFDCRIWDGHHWHHHVLSYNDVASCV